MCFNQSVNKYESSKGCISCLLRQQFQGLFWLIHQVKRFNKDFTPFF